jgi:copper chaperone CopZ
MFRVLTRLPIVALLFAFTPMAPAAETAAAADHAVEGEAAPAKPVATKLKIAATETAIYVDDMHCAGCAKKISGRLYRLKGVVKVRTDLKAHLAVVTPQAKREVDAKAAWEAVQKAGFQPTKLVGPQGTFVAHEKTKKPEKVAETAAQAAPRG